MVRQCNVTDNYFNIRKWQNEILWVSGETALSYSGITPLAGAKEKGRQLTDCKSCRTVIGHEIYQKIEDVNRKKESKETNF